MCYQCDLGAMHNTMHMIIQCPAHATIRRILYDTVKDICQVIEQYDYFSIIMGKYKGTTFGDMLPIWLISCSHILVFEMYRNTMKARGGIG